MANHKSGSHHHAMKTGNHGGFTPAPGHEEGPGYPMSKHGAQDAGEGGRQGGRQSHNSHVNNGKSESYETEGKMD